LSIDDETVLLVMAYQDGELSPSEALKMERRLASEPELQTLAGELRGLSGRLQGVLSAGAVPSDLRACIVSAVGLSDEMPAVRHSLRWLPLAASMLVGIFIGAGVVAGLGHRSMSVDHSIEDTLYQAHLRSLAAPQPFDIASSDRHVVKPWFNGRTSIAPSAPDLGSVGFPLVGGRIDIVSGISVPVLVYRHDRHIISVTVLARQPAGADTDESRDGSNIDRRTMGDLSYWAVSDLNSADLRQFMDAFLAASR